MKRKIVISTILFVFVLALIPVGRWAVRKEVKLRPAKMGISTIRLYDTERERPVVTEVWYPVDESTPADPVEGLWVRCAEARDAPLKATKQYPLIVMSHGNWGDRFNNAWIAETLAANGYIVASMDHYGNTWNNKIPENFLKLWDRPQDITFVIDQILQDEKFGPHIDKSKVGFVGYSLGGFTGIWIAGGKLNTLEQLQMRDIPKEHLPPTMSEEIFSSIDFSPAVDSYRDSRVNAVFVMAPALGHFFDTKSLEAISIPVHIVASAGDTVVSTESSARVLASTIKKGVLMLIAPTASHFVFVNQASQGGKMLIDKQVACDPPEVDRAKIHEEVAISAVCFFNRHL